MSNVYYILEMISDAIQRSHRCLMLLFGESKTGLWRVAKGWNRKSSRQVGLLSRTCVMIAGILDHRFIYGNGWLPKTRIFLTRCSFDDDTSDRFENGLYSVPILQISLVIHQSYIPVRQNVSWSKHWKVWFAIKITLINLFFAVIPCSRQVILPKQIHIPHIT